MTLHYRAHVTTNMRTRAALGFTLVELLIVIGIIGLLLQLLLPAIEMSRESARRVNCSNNLRQLGLASQLHQDVHDFYPSGGWMPFWVGDPLRGFGRDQPGGWVYNLLPYVEAEAIHRLPDDDDADLITERQKAAAGGMTKIPLSIMQCSSRRLPRAYPYWLNKSWKTLNADRSEKVARSDYAANGGDNYDPEFAFFEHGDAVDSSRYSSLDKHLIWADTQHMTGVCFVRSEVKNSQISDGLTNTYLLGEKYLNSNYYTNGWDPGDNHSMYQGYDKDVIRWANHKLRPHIDREKIDISEVFGSVHPSGFQMVFCGGSVRQIHYNIDLEVHRRQANRRDGEAGSPSTSDN